MAHPFSGTLKKYFRFSRIELNNLLLSILILGLIVGFNDGSKTFVFGHWLFNLFNSILIVFLVLFIHISAQKIVGLRMGYLVEYKIWTIGLVIALVVGLLSGGKLWLLISGGIFVSHMIGERLGKFRYGFNYFQQGIVATMGAVANILFAVVVKVISKFSPSVLADKFVLVSIVFALLSLLPIPPLDGSHMFFGSRVVYILFFFSLIGVSALIYLTNFWLALIGGFLIGIISMLLFMRYVEEK